MFSMLKSLRKNSQFWIKEKREKKRNENKMKMALMICVDEQLYGGRKKNVCR
jgi:hypothetical protein